MLLFIVEACLYELKICLYKLALQNMLDHFEIGY